MPNYYGRIGPETIVSMNYSFTLLFPYLSLFTLLKVAGPTGLGIPANIFLLHKNLQWPSFFFNIKRILIYIKLHN